MGQGNLLIALIQYGVEKGFKPNELPLLNLFGNEINTIYHKEALQFFQNEFNTDMSGNFSNRDILELPSALYDIVLGNPPWQTFNDLPEAYKKNQTILRKIPANRKQTQSVAWTFPDRHCCSNHKSNDPGFLFPEAMHTSSCPCHCFSTMEHTKLFAITLPRRHLFLL